MYSSREKWELSTRGYQYLTEGNQIALPVSIRTKRWNFCNLIYLWGHVLKIPFTLTVNKQRNLEKANGGTFVSFSTQAKVTKSAQNHPKCVTKTYIQFLPDATGVSPLRMIKEYYKNILRFQDSHICCFI